MTLPVMVSGRDTRGNAARSRRDRGVLLLPASMTLTIRTPPGIASVTSPASSHAIGRCREDGGIPRHARAREGPHSRTDVDPCMGDTRGSFS